MSPSRSMQIANERNKLDSFKTRSRREGNDVISTHNRDIESFSNSPITSSFCNNDSRKGIRESKSGSSSSSCSLFCSEEDEDECLDDWEAIADALNADEYQQHREISNSSVKSEIVIGLADHEQANKNSGVHFPKPENQQSATWSRQAWMPDDAFRPQNLPTLSSKHNMLASSGWHCGRREINWELQNVMSQPCSCPICYENLDLTDSSFLPCPCGFRLCLFCHKRILESDGRCPGCRKLYDLANKDIRFNGGTSSFQVVHYCSMTASF